MTGSVPRKSGSSAAAMTSSRSLSRRSRVISLDHQLDVAQLAAVQVPGEQLGVGQGDRDRGAQMMRGVLEEPALRVEQAGVLLADELAFGIGADPPVGVPHGHDEHRGQQRYLGRLLDPTWLSCSRSRPIPAERGDEHDPEPPRDRVGGPQPQPVEQGEPDRDEVEGDRVPGRPGRDRDEVQQDQGDPGQRRARSPRLAAREPGTSARWPSADGKLVSLAPHGLDERSPILARRRRTHTPTMLDPGSKS